MSLAEKYLVQTLKETISQFQYLLGLSPGARMAIKTGSTERVFVSGYALTCQHSHRVGQAYTLQLAETGPSPAEVRPGCGWNPLAPTPPSCLIEVLPNERWILEGSCEAPGKLRHS